MVGSRIRQAGLRRPKIQPKVLHARNFPNDAQLLGHGLNSRMTCNTRLCADIVVFASARQSIYRICFQIIGMHKDYLGRSLIRSSSSRPWFESDFFTLLALPTSHYHNQLDRHVNANAA